MEYKVEEISPVKTKIIVSVPAEEADAALTATIAMYRTSTDIKGFRKGKVPSSVVESRFKKQIVAEATNDLLNVHINQVMGELALNPLSRLDVDEVELERGVPLEYSFSFEHSPRFELPVYKGLSVTENLAVADPKDVDSVVERIRNNMAEVKTVNDRRLPKDGDVVVVSFQAYDNGEPMSEIKAENFQLTLGEGQALPDFETLVKTIYPGAEGEGNISFPEDFINKELAGKTVLMKASLSVIKEKNLPEVNDEFAEKAGNFESVEKMRQAIANSYVKTRQELYKAEAQKKLLDELLSMVDFPLPPSVVDMHMGGMLQDFAERLERQGKSMESSGKTLDELRAEFQPKAEELVKSQIFLLAVAAKEGLQVSPTEIDEQLNQIASRAGQDLLTVKQYYEDKGLIVPLKDKILTDKAMDLIYDKSEVVKQAIEEAKPEA